MDMSRSPAELIHRTELLLERQAELANRWACEVPDCDGLPHEGWVHRHARATQREPDDYEVWGIVTGRGYGKTRTGSETTKGWTKSRRQHIAVIGKTHTETRNICFEGPAGLLNVIRPNMIKDYHRSLGDISLTLTNGSVFRAFSAEKPDAIRGYAFDGGWFDEYAAFPVQTAEMCWDNLQFALREAKHPRVIITTTPRNLDHVKLMLAECDAITRGSMLENRANLSERQIARLLRKYEGTRIGRQELEGELVEDVEGALWTYYMIHKNRFEVAPFMENGILDIGALLAKLNLWRIVVGVDPAGRKKINSDETGIVVVGVGGNRSRPHLYILEDASGRYSPDEWAKMAIVMHDKWGADAIAAEVNNGWDMVNSTIRHQDDRPRIVECNAARGKHIRAEPIVALYEQDRAHHVGNWKNLEDQMTSWTPFDTESPDRLDALVWAATELTRRSTEMASTSLAAMNTLMDPFG